MTIIFAGMIGAGKTTLSNAVGQEFNLPVFHEPVDDNPVLSLFYKDRKRYGYLLQTYLLTKRSNIILKSKLIEDKNDMQTISDRSLNEDFIFAQQLRDAGDLSQVEYSIYEELSTTFQKSALKKNKKKDLLIYLKTDFEHILEHIKKRGREFEQLEENQSLLDYYKDIWSRYDKWYSEQENIDRIKFDNFDINNEEDKAKLFEVVNNYL